jgi:hypothetical protein
LVIIYYAPVLQKGDEFIWLENYKYARYALLFSASLSVYTIFQFRKRSRQILLSSFSRLLITLSLILIILEIKGEEMKFAYGLFLLLIPYLTLFLAGYFVKKDEKLVKSADRIR